MTGSGAETHAETRAGTTADTAARWDAEAPTFDEAPDHGLRDPAVRAVWRGMLPGVLPPAPARVADLGCGTGTLSGLLADEGYDVDGVDVSPAMVELAEAKAGDRCSFMVADAADPPLPVGAYDVVLCRHVLWALPDPAAALRRWVALLAPDGRLVLVEGSWHTGAGLTAEQTVALLDGVGRTSTVRHLPEVAWWGREIDDERYLVVSAL
jgi:SAM-dependent methyltransferase